MSDQLLPPNEETTGIDTYTKWIWKKWLVLLSSGEIAFLLLIWGLIGFTITALPILILIYSLFFIAQVYVATYQIWEAEREDKLSIIKTVEKQTLQIEKLSFEKDSLGQETKQLQSVLLQNEKDRKPHLMGSVTDIHIYPVINRAGNILGTRISLFVGITNASTVPTTISGFILDVADKDGGHFLSYTGEDPSKFGFSKQECMVSQNELSDKNQRLANRFSNRQKAELGERNEGWLFFDFDLIKDLDKNFDWSNNITLKIVDAFEEKHQINGGLLKKYDKAD
jgi:hypothetical protein